MRRLRAGIPRTICVESVARGGYSHAHMSVRMFRRIIVSRPGAAALAAVALLAAQAVVVHHDPVSERHAPDSICVFCVAGANLAGANLGYIGMQALAGVSLDPPQAVLRTHSSAPPQYHFARAPPAAS